MTTDSIHSTDRSYWVKLLHDISKPVLENMSCNQLRKNMQVECSPVWDGRSKNVAYMEAFGRTVAGISPWLNLPDDESWEGLLRKKTREWCLSCYQNAVDTHAPDYLEWDRESQALVDAAYIANSFLRAPDATWNKLNNTTQERYICEFNRLKRIKPPYSNWLLFRAIIEVFLLSIDEEYDKEVLIFIIKKINEWYVGDGWYSDGPDFAFDYYNSFVIHPMLVEILEVCKNKGIQTPVSFELALKRMQRYNILLERLVSPEAAFPPIGRSITYRMGAFQPLALSAWKYHLPENLSSGQIRNMLTQVMKRMFSSDKIFTEQVFLQLGFIGHQPNLADYYTNTGSLYMTTLSFLPLGLKPEHDFWTALPQKWTSQKAWNEELFAKDYKQSLRL